MQSLAVIQKSKMTFLLEELTYRNFNQFTQIADNALLINQPLKDKPLFCEAFSPIEILKFSSTEDAIKLLSEKSPNQFYNLPTGWFKRADSISDGLKTLKRLPLLNAPPAKDMALISVWGLLDAQTAFVTKEEKLSPAALGKFDFMEPKVPPPSRAYLKLWNLFYVQNLKILPTARILELGASPGGWSWVLQKYCDKLRCIDRAPLDPSLMKNPKITFLKGDAFTLSNSLTLDHDWFFSDLICEPAKLLQSVKSWKSQNPNLGIVATIKFKGPTDFEIIKEFKKIKNSTVIHLYQNKHEVMFVSLPTK